MNKQVYENVISKSIFKLLLIIFILTSGKTASAQDFSSAMSINVNTYMQGNVTSGYGEEQNYYMFSVPEDGYIVLNFTNPLQQDNDKYWKMYLYNSEYNELIGGTPIYGNLASTNSTAVGIPAGVYYVKIQSSAYGYAMSTDIYGLNIKYTASDTWEKELNDTFTDATPIVTNVEYYGTTDSGYSSENDYYTFKIVQDGCVTLNFTNPLQSNDDHYWSMYLYNGKYEEICFRKIYGNKDNTKAVSIGVEEGTYYIKIQSSAYEYAMSTDIYGITARFEASDYWEKEFNDEFTTATKIKMDTRYYGTSCAGYEYEKDYYSIDISDTGVYAVDIYTDNLSNDDKYWAMYLYDSSYNEIGKTYVYGNKTKHTIAGVLSNGTYYIKVESTDYNIPASDTVYSICVTKGNSNTIKENCSHEYDTRQRDATYFKNGYTLHVCELCGYSYKDNYISKKILSQGYVSSYSKGGNKSLELSWLSVDGATGYQIRYYINKSSKKTKNIIGTSCTIRGLKRKKTYKVQVRAYVKEGSKTAYGKWSEVRKIRTL